MSKEYGFSGGNRGKQAENKDLFRYGLAGGTYPDGFISSGRSRDG